MSTAQKLITAASGVGGEGIYVEDVFSTTTYTGTGSSLSITNNLDLSGEGGFVWFKSRSATRNHSIYDTARGTGKRLLPNNQGAGSAETTDNNGLSAFLSNGFTVVSADDCNKGSDSYVSWAWRKAEKFCDIVTYTGNEDSDRYIAHNLGVAPGMMIIKDRSANGVWTVYHRSLGGTKHLRLSTTDAAITDSGTFDNNSPTDTTFAVGLDGATNGDGNDYVCWLFAHNDGDGGFGESGDQDSIKCGSYTTDSNEDATINLGFEPQWLLVKRSDSSTAGDWRIIDNVRGWQAGGDAAYLEANTSDAEAQSGDGRYYLTSTGFRQDNFGANRTYIYVAIRKGPMKIPEVATTVFNVQQTSGGGYTSPGVELITNTGFPVDMSIGTRMTSSINLTATRLQGKTKYMGLDRATAEASANEGYIANWGSSNSLFVGDIGGLNDSGATAIVYNFRRAPSFFDVVLYTGTGSATTVTHNLGVTPELIIIKNRGSVGDWIVYSRNDPTDHLQLNATDATSDEDRFFNDTAPTSSVFTVGDRAEVNSSSNTYISYLFASASGVSKVGTYTGNGSSQTIDCGFSNGARFVMTKRVDATSHWNVFDSVRGIVAGNDPRLEFDTDAAQDTGHDYIDPASSGFAVNYVAADDDDSNVNSATYIFMAIA